MLLGANQRLLLLLNYHRGTFLSRAEVEVNWVFTLNKDHNPVGWHYWCRGSPSIVILLIDCTEAAYSFDETESD